MRNKNKNRVNIAFFSIIMAILFSFLAGCSGNECADKVSTFKFDFQGDTYKIRSIYQAKDVEPRNELLCKKFYAADYDRDRIIDDIMLGEADMDEAQMIYDYGLALLASENLLEETEPANHTYCCSLTKYNLEIKTFQPGDAVPFNKFRITEKDKELPIISLFIDKSCDGILEETLSGNIPLKDAQELYKNMLEKGLTEEKITKCEDMLVVCR